MAHAMRDTGGVLRQTPSVKKRDAGNVLRTIQLIKKRDASNVLRTIFSALSASVAPPDIIAYGNSAAPVDIDTAPATATPDGGSAPYTYLWTRTDINPETWTIITPTAAITYFTASAIGAGLTGNATFKCTVTDAGGATADTPEITVAAINLGGS